MSDADIEAATGPFHRLANLFKLIKGKEFDDLVASVRLRDSRGECGIIEKIVILDGLILDGRNRWRACVAAGLLPPDLPAPGTELFIRYFRLYSLERDGDPLDFVIDLNLNRRHMDESQRAMAAADVANMRQGERTDLEPTANLPKVDQATAAEKFHVSERSVRTAKAVKDHGAPELQDAVRQGDVSVSAAQAITSLPIAEQAEIVAKGEAEILAAAKQINAEKRDARRKERFEDLRRISTANAPLPADRKYPVIYLDPPWKFESGFSDRSIENHYPTMTVDEICALPVRELAADISLMAIWFTAPMLLARCSWTEGEGDSAVVVHGCVADRVLRAFGFEYVSCGMWDKVDSGTGYWFFNQHEILVLATRGAFPAPDPLVKARSVHTEKKGKHSAKPDYYRELIERYTPGLARIELFCRTPREGWAVWGNQSGGPCAEGEAIAPAIDRPAVPAPISREMHGDRDADAQARSDELFDALSEIEAGIELTALLATCAIADQLKADGLISTGKKSVKLTKLGDKRLDKLTEDRLRRNKLDALPTDIDELAKLYHGQLLARAVHVRNSDGAGVDAATDRLELLQERANGNTMFGMACNDSPAEILRTRAAAPIGTPPMWGQRGIFRLLIDDVPYIVTHDDDCDFAIHAETPLLPFASETGYLSFAGDPLVLGRGVAEQAEALIRDTIATEYNQKTGKLKARTKPLPTPAHWYRMPTSWDEANEPICFGREGKAASAPAAEDDAAIVDCEDGDNLRPEFERLPEDDRATWRALTHVHCGIVSSGPIVIELIDKGLVETTAEPDFEIQLTPAGVSRLAELNALIDPAGAQQPVEIPKFLDADPAGQPADDERDEWDALTRVAKGGAVLGEMMRHLIGCGLISEGDDLIQHVTPDGAARLAELNAQFLNSDNLVTA